MTKFLLVTLLFFTSTLPQAMSCGWDGSANCYGVERSFFAPEIIDQPSANPFFLSCFTFYDGLYAHETELSKNLFLLTSQEWESYLNGPFSTEDIGHWLSSNTDQPGKSLMAKTPLEDRMNRFSEYVSFAKKVEPFATRSWMYWQNNRKPLPNPEPKDFQSRIDEGNKFATLYANDKFLELHYRFQVLRLYFYSGDYAKVISYYQEHESIFRIKAVPASPSIAYRSLDLLAGAQFHLGKYAESNHLHSLIFDQFTPLKKESYLSFHPQEESDWAQSLALAKTTREKTVLWQLVGLHEDSKRGMEEIFKLDPRSNLLPLLLVRLVNETEKEMKIDTIVGSTERVDPESISLVKKIADSKKNNPLAVWEISLAYLYALDGDAGQSASYLAKADKLAGVRVDYQEQIRITRTLNLVRKLQAPNRTIETPLAGNLEELSEASSEKRKTRASYLVTTLHQSLSQIYTAKNDFVRGFLFAKHFLIADDLRSKDNSFLEQLLAFVKKPKPGPLDAYLIEKNSHRVNPESIRKVEALNDLYTGHFQEAADILKTLPLYELSAGPFLMHMRDCHDCDHAAYKSKLQVHTLNEFASQMADYSAKSKTSAEASYQLANGLYSMSFYGNSRDIFSYHGSNDDPEHHQTIPAEKAYTQAANLSKDPEFKAKAIYMAARTMHNRRQYFKYKGLPAGQEIRDASITLDGENLKSPDPWPEKEWYFRVLKEHYSNTSYYKDIIRECGYFRGYLEKPL
jgi:hypothetical protein